MFLKDSSKNLLKSMLIAAFLLLINFNSFSQNFISNQKVWSYAPPITNVGTMYQSGDSQSSAISEDSILIDGLYYRKLCITEALFPNYEDVSNCYSSYLHIREDDTGKVYLKYNDNPEYLRYDFALEIGDFFSMPTSIDPFIYTDIQLSLIDTVYDLLNNPRKRYIFDGDVEKWIEGIGSVTSFSVMDGQTNLLCFKEDTSELVYPTNMNLADCSYAIVNNFNINTESELEIIPNPTREYFSINSSFDLKMDQVQIFDSFGKKVNFKSTSMNGIDTSDWLKGLYYIVVNNEGKLFTRKIIKI